jgi:nucleoside-diphosphate-sugar epimerase
MSSRVLVTGGSGFVGGHCILQLLAAGYDVRTTVRDLKREPEVRATLAKAGTDPGSRLRFFAADLTRDTGWAQAVGGCDFVLHVASPLPWDAPQHEDELIVPARDGARRVLRTARDAGVKRVVLTSSFAAIGYGQPPRERPFDESDWSNVGAKLAPYVKSKTVAERAAWDFVAAEGRGLELSVVNPVGIFGPVLGPDISSSIQVIQRMLEGRLPACPQVYFAVVDVRDVADLHLRAMTNPAAAGQRFIAAASDCVPMIELARALRAGLGAAAARAPTRQVPNWLVRLAALRDQRARQVLPELGKVKHVTNAKAVRVLDWKPRQMAEAVVATAESLLRFGLVQGAAKT